MKRKVGIGDGNEGVVGFGEVACVDIYMKSGLSTCMERIEV